MGMDGRLLRRFLESHNLYRGSPIMLFRYDRSDLPPAVNMTAKEYRWIKRGARTLARLMRVYATLPKLPGSAGSRRKEEGDESMDSAAAAVGSGSSSSVDEEEPLPVQILPKSGLVRQGGSGSGERIQLKNGAYRAELAKGLEETRIEKQQEAQGEEQRIAKLEEKAAEVRGDMLFWRRLGVKVSRDGKNSAGGNGNSDEEEEEDYSDDNTVP